MKRKQQNVLGKVAADVLTYGSVVTAAVQRDAIKELFVIIGSSEHSYALARIFKSTDMTQPLEGKCVLLQHVLQPAVNQSNLELWQFVDCTRLSISTADKLLSGGHPVSKTGTMHPDDLYRVGLAILGASTVSKVVKTAYLSHFL